MTNEFCANMKNEKILSGEFGYQFSSNWIKANINAYYSKLSDVTEWQNFFDDDINSFSYVSMTGIKKEYYGVEVGIKASLNSNWSVRGVAALNLKPIDGLTVTSRFGYRISQSQSHSYEKPYWLTGMASSSNYSISANNNSHKCDRAFKSLKGWLLLPLKQRGSISCC